MIDLNRLRRPIAASPLAVCRPASDREGSQRMKSKQTTRRITLSRETLAHLTPANLAVAAGGYEYTHTCAPTVSQCALSMCKVCPPP
jgi:hypothetical protein